MYRFVIFIIILLSFSCYTAFSQDQGGTQSYPQTTVNYAKPNLIKSGFYLKLGPVFPMGTFATDQVMSNLPYSTEPAYFPAARIGGNLGMGYLIYIGPGVANNYLRFGIDACFIDAWFATSKPQASWYAGKKESELWYFFVGQKFGPLITINPVDRLMIDLSYKLNFNMSWHDSDWGYDITGQELMMNIRYRVFMIGLHYDFGTTINYNDFDNSRPVHDVAVTTFRVLLGFKF